jgi:hypothetical protein
MVPDKIVADAKAKRRILVVDDTRNFPFAPDTDGTTVRTSKAATDFLGKETEVHVPLDELWLDFDLGFGDTEHQGDETTMPIVYYLAELAYYGSPYPVNKIFIHTSNPVGRAAMGLTLRHFGYDVEDVEAHFGV